MLFSSQLQLPLYQRAAGHERRQSTPCCQQGSAAPAGQACVPSASSVLLAPAAVVQQRLSSATGAAVCRHTVLCHSSSSSQAAPASSSRRTGRTTTPSSPVPSKDSGKGGSSPSASKPVEPLIQVAINTTSAGVATAVLMRLQQLGHAEIWATSAANHFTAVAGVGMAAQQLHRQPPPQRLQQQSGDEQQQQQLEGLAVTAVMTTHDQPVKDDQKRRLNKLELQVQPAQQIDSALLQAGQPGSISTNRTTGIADILGFMQQQLLVFEDSSSSRVKEGAVCVVEARGEQAVTRALKAALSLQAAAGQPLLLRPVAAKVVDIVAEKRGQEAVADGLLLLFSWA